MRWAVDIVWDKAWLNLVDENDLVVRTHPIPFDDPREAQRAAARLNARDGLSASSLRG